MPNSTTKENQNQQKFLFSSTTICLTTNIAHRLQQQNTFNNLGRTTGYGRGRLGPRNSRKQIWRMKRRESGDVSERR